MKAVRFHEVGPPWVLKYEDVPRPQFGPGEALVKVQACGVNRVDIWARSGRYKTHLPHTLGTDVSGEVVEVSQPSADIAIGDRVVVYGVLSDGTCKYCQSGHTNRCVNIGLFGVASDGGYSQFVKVQTSNLIKFEGLDFPTAAAIPVNFATAWNAFVNNAKVNSSDVVLVWAAGSGVGHAAVQIARLRGATVIATAGSDEKLPLLKEIGAHHVINHTNEDVVQKVKEITYGYGADVVFDHIGGDTWQKSLEALAKGGRMVSLGVTTTPSSEVDIGRLYRNELSIIGTYAYGREDLLAVLDLAAAGRIRPRISRRLPLKSAREAHEALESRTNFGKIVLLPWEGE